MGPGAGNTGSHVATMPGNIFGELFKVTTFGESHGPAFGCVIDGCPAGLELSIEDIKQELERRRPGVAAPSLEGNASTSRNEADEPEILSGLFEGKTLGTPLAILVRNTNCHSADYDALRDVYRPGHADFGWQAKYGIRDHRGGGRSSGRETLCRVAAGAVAKKFLAVYNMSIRAWTSAIAGITMPRPGDTEFNFDEVEKSPLRVPCTGSFAEQAIKAIEALRAEGDSAGGIVSCLVHGLPPGLGEPVFDNLDARLAGAMLSIGAARGIEFGAGFAAAALKGSENNARSEGILGGISSGKDIEFKVAFKPTPSIGKPQKALNKDGETVDLNIKGRHDVCIVPRAVPVVEAMTALVLADFILLQRRSPFIAQTF
jgi:chorismate synthase